MKNESMRGSQFYEDTDIDDLPVFAGMSVRRKGRYGLSLIRIG